MKIITDISQLDLTKEYTYSDYLKWQFTERVELIKGFIKKMSPAPSMNHQLMVYDLTIALHAYFKDKSCKVFFAPFDVRLPIKSGRKNTTVVQPDLCIICNENKLDEKGCNGAPDLIVEILSPKNNKHDLVTKYNLYQEAKVQEYWIVEPEEKMVLVYTLKDDTYIGSKPFAQGETIQSFLFKDLNVSVDDIFKRITK